MPRACGCGAGMRHSRAARRVATRSAYRRSGTAARGSTPNRPKPGVAQRGQRVRNRVANRYASPSITLRRKGLWSARRSGSTIARFSGECRSASATARDNATRPLTPLLSAVRSSVPAGRTIQPCAGRQSTSDGLMSSMLRTRKLHAGNEGLRAVSTISMPRLWSVKSRISSCTGHPVPASSPYVASLANP